MKKIDVYTLGQFGVNRVKSPVHVLDGELLSSQNASPKLVAGQLAITKRDGMAKINTSAANGSIVNISNIPINEFGTNANSVCALIEQHEWRAAAWSPELEMFAVTGIDLAAKAAATSPDGVTWTVRTTPNFVGQDICWCSELSKFVAVGQGTSVLTSPDGVTWTAQVCPNGDWQGVAYSPTLNIFVAVGPNAAGTGGVAMSSPDAVTWTSRTPASAVRFWRDVVWAESLALFVKVSEVSGVTNNVGTSPDGINWTLRNTGTIQSSWNKIAWSSELERLVAVGTPYDAGLTTYAMYSDDGINWNPGFYTASNIIATGVAWSPELGIFMAAQRGTTNGCAISSDGETWLNITSNCGQDIIYDIEYSPALRQFLLVYIDEMEMIS